MAVYKCHRGCVGIHRGSYQLFRRASAPAKHSLPLSPLCAKWSWCVYIDTHLLSAISVASLWWNMDVCLALFHPASSSKSVPHAYLLMTPKSCQLVAACPLPPLFFFFPLFYWLHVSLCDEIWMRVLSLSVPFFLPLTGCFSQVSLWWNMDACPLSFSPPLTGCLCHASLWDEIWMSVPCWSCECKMLSIHYRGNYVRPLQVPRIICAVLTHEVF